MTEMTKTALIKVDIQPDFLPGGPLGVPGGDAIIPVVVRLAESGQFTVLVASRDAHPHNHMSFAEHGGIWPKHCVDGTPGAQLHDDIAALNPVIFNKATEQHVDAYSSFDGTGLADELRAQNITRVVVVGLATDYCVLATVLDALREGFEVIVITDAIAAVNVEAGDGDRALATMQVEGATLMTSDEFLAVEAAA
jgi:nicotinamidase/pyrazinamidase